MKLKIFSQAIGSWHPGEEPFEYFASKKIVERCKIFALEQLESGSGALYSRHNRGSSSNIFENIWSGKLAEFVVHDYAMRMGAEASGIDWEIRNGKKGWEPDLYVNSFPCSVKSTTKTFHGKYWFTWDAHDPDLQHPEGVLFAPVVVEIAKKDFVRALAYGITWLEDVIPLLELPILPQYRTTKRCLDLQKLQAISKILGDDEI